jgi:hypothetical protein
MTKSQKFIEANKRLLECGRDYYNPDTSLMPLAEFAGADIKLLIIFPSPSDVKAVSTTKEALNDFVQSVLNKGTTPESRNVFIDFAYVPSAVDMKVFDKNNMPHAIGNITHLDPSNFDMVGFSISVLAEVITAPCMIKTFNRCDCPIPLTWSERKDTILGTHPIIYAGGITAACSDIMFGELGDGRQAFVDYLYLGSAEGMQPMFDKLQRQLEVVRRLKEETDVLDSSANGLTIQGYIDTLFEMPMIYQPQAYEVKFNDKNQIISNRKINPKAQDFVKPYYPLELEPLLSIGRSIINADGDGVGVAQTQVAEGCSAAGCCSFCMEGNYCGGWVEKTREQVLWEVREAKKYSAAYKYKPYSFNANYFTDYKGMLYEFMKLYPKVTFINMRMEELGRDVDALKMMKLIGSNRISAPMEGISPRIQNNLLNKCLSEESLVNFMDDMIHAKLTDIKVGGIFTGYEEDEDFQWICDFVDSYKKRAKAEGGNFPFRLKVTPLVSYNLTPCEYIERKSAKKSYNGDHWLTDEWYEKFKEHNVFFKVNGFRYSTFIEQSIIDLGRFATSWMYKNIVVPEIPVYSLRSFAKEEIVDELKKLINSDYFFEARDPEHYISISHRIHIDLMGSYIPRARRLVRAYKNGNIFDNTEDVRCLKTFEGAKTKCYSSCIVKDPLKIYNDVEMDEDGNLHGDYRLLNGCERCPDNEHKKQRIARPVPQTKDSNDIIAAPRLKRVQKLRFILERSRDYDLLNPNNTAHTFMAKLLQKSEKLVDIYHSIEGHSNYWQSDADLPYTYSGVQVVDAIFTTNEALDIVKGLIPEVNKELKSIQIQSVKEEFVDDKLKVDDYNIFRFETTLPMELFEVSAVSYKGEIKVKNQELVETRIDKDLMAPSFVSKGRVVGYFALPFRYNPLMYLQGLLKDKKIPINRLKAEVVLQNMMIVRSASSICKCGKESGVISMVTGKQMNLGLKCLPKALISRELKNNG